MVTLEGDINVGVVPFNARNYIKNVRSFQLQCHERLRPRYFEVHACQTYTRYITAVLREEAIKYVEIIHMFVL